MNKVILMGRLTKDPEVSYSRSAEPLAVAKYTLAVNRRMKKQGESDADFIPCTVFGKAGEFAGQFFKKGMMVCVSGRIQVRTWDDPSGQKRWSTDVIVDEQDFAESKSSFESRSQSQPSYESSAPSPRSNSEPEGFAKITENVEDEDSPF